MEAFELRPGLGAQSEQNCWEIVRTVIQHVLLILSIRSTSTRLQVLGDHRDEKLEQLGAWIQSLVANDEGAEELRGRLFDPLRGVLSKLLEYFKQWAILDVVWSELTDLW